VLDGLAEIGYTAESFVVGAGNAGAPHIRQRCLVVAHSKGIGRVSPTVYRGRMREKTPTWGCKPRLVGRITGRPWIDPSSRNIRMDDGVSRRVDRLTVVGNAVCPQVVFAFLNPIGRYLSQLEASK
jgi:site-specific DNA-cytosine methylase